MRSQNLLQRQSSYVAPAPVASSDDQSPFSCELNVVSVSIEYPNPTEPGKGLFVRARLQALAEIVNLKILSPIPLLDYANPGNHWFSSRGIPRQATDGPATVLYPRWIYPPQGGFVNAFCLFFRLLLPLYRLNRKGELDLLDAHFVHPDGVAAALAAGVFRKRFVVTARGSELRHRQFRLRRFWMAWAIRRAARVIAVSENLRQFAIEMGADPKRVKVIPNGVDGEVFFPHDRARCREKLGIRPEACVILSAGDLAEIKGHHRVIRALQQLREKGTYAELLIAGGVGRSGRYAEVLRREVESCGVGPQVRFLGEVRQTQLAELMSAADVFCLASSREGCPNVVTEALACGTPVVGTDVGAVRQLVPAREYGQVVALERPEELHSALQDALTRQRDRDAIAAWGGRRTWRQVAGEVAAEMRQVMAKSVIINADDLGISPTVNDAIFTLMAQKRITSATLMVNAPAIEDAVRGLRNVDGCSFGIHLNLTEFQPLTAGSGAKAITDDDGLMRRSIACAAPIPARMSAIYEELCAQIERLRSWGVPISHMDSHHHVHTVPYILPIVKAVQRRYGIRKIRLTKNIYSEQAPCSAALRVKKSIFNQVLKTGSETTDGFTEMMSFWSVARNQRIRYGTVELMVHPGAPYAVEETALLQSKWEESLPFAVRLVSYNDLSGDALGRS
jgi:teichuronic acid biosynthesis glycosyltransferase TuaC